MSGRNAKQAKKSFAATAHKEPKLPEGVELAALFKSAIMVHDLKSVKDLVKRDAWVDVRDEEGMTPLMWAAYYGHVDIVKELLKAGAAVSYTKFDYTDHTAASLASICGHHAVLELLHRATERLSSEDLEWQGIMQRLDEKIGRVGQAAFEAQTDSQLRELQSMGYR